MIGRWRAAVVGVVRFAAVVAAIVLAAYLAHQVAGWLALHRGVSPWSP